MKIGFVCGYYKPAYVYGGPIRTASVLCESLVRAGAEVTVLTTNANGNTHLDVPLGQAVDVDGVRVFYYPSNANNRFTYLPHLSQACEEQLPQFDVVIAEIIWSFLVQTIRRVCQKSGVPYIVTPHGQLLPWAMNNGFFKKNVFLRLFAYSYLQNAAALRATDSSEAELLTKLGLATPIITIPNSIDMARFEVLPTRGKLRQQLGIDDNASVLLFLGRLHHKKRPDIAVKTLIAVRRAGFDSHLILAGPDESNMTDTLAAYAQQAGMSSYIHPIGLLQGNDILQALRDSDLMLMPSMPQSENFGMSALEAMATGLPVLLSDGIPVGMSIVEAKAGLMVTCDEVAFGNAAIEMLMDRQALQQMGFRGRPVARHFYNDMSVTQTMISHLKEVCKHQIL